MMNKAYYIPKKHFFKYLQLKHFILSILFYLNISSI